MKEMTNNLKDINNYDFLDLSYDPKTSLPYAKKMGGKKGLSFEADTSKYNQLTKNIQNNKELKEHKILNENPLKIRINENNKKQFDFTVSLDFIDTLNGLGETNTLLYKATQLTKKFIFISHPNYDSDMNLFKKGFKTFYSDWSRNTNHITSSQYFNLLLNFYQKGYINEYMIFYKNPITGSDNTIIHPLNSPKNQPKYDEKIHPIKDKEVKFDNVYRNINVLISTDENEDIDKIFKSVNGEKKVIYDSRKGIFDY